MDEFNRQFKIQLLGNYDLNTIPLITETFTPLNVPQSQIHRVWNVGDLVLLSYSGNVYQPGTRSMVWFHYVVEVVNEHGRGLQLVVPRSFDTHDRPFKQMYRDNFMIPMLMARTSFTEFSEIYANNTIPADSYFADGEYVLFDTAFVNAETCPLWYILNHQNSDVATMYLTVGNFKPKSTLKIQRSGFYPLSIFYGKTTQKNVNEGKELNDSMVDMGETKTYDLRFV